MKNYHSKAVEVGFPLFYSDSYRDTSNTRARFTLRDSSQTDARRNYCASGDLLRSECELLKFAFSCIRFVAHPTLTPTRSWN